MAEDRPPRVEILLFGGPIVRVGDIEVRKFPTQYAAALLTLLALRPNHHYDRDEFCRLLWSDEEPSATRQRLRENLFQLRKLIPGGSDLIQSSRQSIWLANGEAPFVDALEFDRLLELARETEEPHKRRRLQEAALEIHSGPLTPALDGDGFQSLRDLYEERAAECHRALEEAAAPRATRRFVKPLLAAAALAVLLLIVRPWSRLRAEGPPLSADQRIAILEGLRGKSGRERERAEHCLALAEDAAKTWYGAGEADWIKRLRLIDSDLKVCVEWLIRCRPEDAVRISGALGRYWYIEKQNLMAGNLLDRALKRGSEKPSLFRARALEALAFAQLGDGFHYDYRKGLNYALLGLRMLEGLQHRRVADLAHAYRFCGVFHNAVVDRRSALQDYDKALALFTESNDLAGRAYTLLDRGMVMRPWLSGQGGFAAQARDEQEALHLFLRVGNDRGIEEAFAELKGLAARPELTDGPRSILVAFEQDCRVQLLRSEQRLESGERAQIWKSLGRVARVLGDQSTVVEALWQLAAFHVSEHHSEKSLLLCGAYLAHAETLKNPPVTATQARMWGRRWYGPPSTRDDADKLLRRGAALSLSAALDLALE